jgi:hypothetical protein
MAMHEKRRTRSSFPSGGNHKRRQSPLNHVVGLSESETNNAPPCSRRSAEARSCDEKSNAAASAALSRDGTVPVSHQVAQDINFPS